MTSRWRCPVGWGVTGPAFVGPPPREEIRKHSSGSYWDMDGKLVDPKAQGIIARHVSLNLKLKKKNQLKKHSGIQFKKYLLASTNRPDIVEGAEGVTQEFITQGLK